MVYCPTKPHFSRDWRLFVAGFGFFLVIGLAGWTPLYADKNIRFSANSVKSSFEKGNEQTALNGNADVSTGSLRITADQITIIGDKQRYVRASGNLVVRDEERDLIIQGATMNYDRELETVKLEGNAVLEDFKNDLLIRAMFFEYHLNENSAILNVGVRLYRKDLEAKAEYASYIRDANMLELTGLPVVHKGKDTYRAGFIRVNTKTDDIQLVGAVTGDVDSSKKGDATASTAPAASLSAPTIASPSPSPPTPGPEAH
jgi:lipopolysaccharide export system protein LptA